MKISGWGRFPYIESEGFYFETRNQLLGGVQKQQECIVYARGRSYGDSALNRHVICTDRFDKILAFDAAEGIVTCESGVTLAEIIEAFLPRGWFLSVTPGTRLISIGGAIASDVHGKNHHKAGCFSTCVVSFNLMLPDGDIVRCSSNENPELFHATCGGMGLTGVILEATIRLQPVKSAYIREKVIRCKNLEDVIQRFEDNFDTAYSVAWIDCLAKGDDQGRSVLMLGEHADSGRLSPPVEKTLSVPFTSPAVFLNKFSVSLFNHFYYSRQPVFTDGRLTPIHTFFYPLDKIGHWNRMYGSNGFTQYQLVLPKEAGKEGLSVMLDKISGAGLGSFLAVLKLFGAANSNYLSFPMEGYTLALDFKIQKKLFPLLDELDRIVLSHGGRIYLTKDVRMSTEVFRSGYPQWEAFSELREKYRMHRKFNSLQSKRLGV
jgi:FAD/FMN-containing dehydrogenase